jgi:hypothetical protein
LHDHAPQQQILPNFMNASVPWMSRAQLLPWRPSATVRIFLLRLGMQSYSRGASPFTALPPIQRSSENIADVPSPMVMLVEAKKRLRSAAENCRSMPCHPLLGSVLLNQSHSKRRAKPARSMSCTLRPP